MKAIKAKLKRWNLLVVIAAFTLLSGCDPVPFSVSGEAIIDGVNHDLTGTMDIKRPVVTDTGNIHFNYEITNFSLDMGITGSGRINSIYYEPGNGDFTCEFDPFELNSDDGTVHWGLLAASGVVFYDEKGDPYQDVGAPTDFYNLPYKIEVTNIGDVGIYFEHLVIERMAPGCEGLP